MPSILQGIILALGIHIFIGIASTMTFFIKDIPTFLDDDWDYIVRRNRLSKAIVLSTITWPFWWTKKLSAILFQAINNWRIKTQARRIRAMRSCQPPKLPSWF